MSLCALISPSYLLPKAISKDGQWADSGCISAVLPLPHFDLAWGFFPCSTRTCCRWWEVVFSVSPLHTPVLRGIEDGCAPWNCRLLSSQIGTVTVLKSLWSGLRPWVHFIIPLLTVWVLAIQLQQLRFICLKSRCFNNSVCFFEEMK